MKRCHIGDIDSWHCKSNLAIAVADVETVRDPVTIRLGIGTLIANILVSFSRQTILYDVCYPTSWKVTCHEVDVAPIENLLHASISITSAKTNDGRNSALCQRTTEDHRY